MDSGVASINTQKLKRKHKAVCGKKGKLKDEQLLNTNKTWLILKNENTRK